ncbi:phosphodiesterase [Salinibacterium soli]|uniref:Phosphodiesterase n=1 Tax=Antiquaquibacter soli TaxID=3064523 RepID=A0ABT9BPH3_9MICO|nr:phosphodiesterase [Protaetiibacter sp. WY-16]MDO7882489.1 phosphodiesterase [Protaetiibacter sp. WY-16]
MIQVGQYPAASHVLAHISDTHFLGGGRKLYGAVDTFGHLELALKQLERSIAQPQALVFTGDLADLGEPDAYERLKSIVEPAAARMNAQIIWVMGNHDERPEYSRILFGQESDAPQDRVYDLDGLRVVSFDTTVPGYHHGEVTDDQLDWLADVLSSPAPHGTIIAVHHPPIPTPMLEAMGMLELQHQERLADVVRGTDVRAILGGHLHYSTHSTFAGIPVSVASATCYTLDLSAEDRILSGVDFGQSINLVHVYEQQLVHSIVPVGDTTEVTGVPAAGWDQIAAMTPEQRQDVFSRKDSDFNRGEQS